MPSNRRRRFTSPGLGPCRVRESYEPVEVALSVCGALSFGGAGMMVPIRRSVAGGLQITGVLASFDAANEI